MPVASGQQDLKVRLKNPKTSSEEEEEEEGRRGVRAARPSLEDVQLLSVGQEDPGILQGSVGCHGEVGIAGGHHVEDAGLEVDVLHRQHLLAERPGLLGRPPATRAALAAGDALAAGAAPHAELQVLLLREGARHLLGRPDGEGELAAGLADGDGGADVLGSDLHVPPGAELPDGQTAAPRPLAAVHRAVLEGGGQVADFGLVNLLVDALLHVLEDDGELRRAQRGAGWWCPPPTSHLWDGNTDPTLLPPHQLAHTPTVLSGRNFLP